MQERNSRQKRSPWKLLLVMALLPIMLLSGASHAQGAVPGAAVDSLDFDLFKGNIATLAAFGDRTQGSASYNAAAAWVESRLTTWGYAVTHHAYSYQGGARTNIYATRIGEQSPDSMYIVSAHLDGRGGGGGADDDASGCALVLELARVFALPSFAPRVSVRFVFWNNEETGLNGSTAYVSDRSPLRGIENPPGSGQYPEPSWAGMIQHDMILFDHGLPPQASQIPNADIDVEYQASATLAAAASALAARLQSGSVAYSSDYPAQIGTDMRNTDSWPFRNFTAAVSVRENRRVSEIGNGANPHWHQPTDVYSTYSEADFKLGFNAAQMTTGTVADLAGLRLLNQVSVPGQVPIAGFRSIPNQPDPFRSSTAIRFSLGRSGPIEVRIFDLHGRLARSLFRGNLESGIHDLVWDGMLESGRSARAGLYVVTMSTPEGSISEKLTLLR